MNFCPGNLCVTCIPCRERYTAGTGRLPLIETHILGFQYIVYTHVCILLVSLIFYMLSLTYINIILHVYFAGKSPDHFLPRETFHQSSTGGIKYLHSRTESIFLFSVSTSQQCKFFLGPPGSNQKSLLQSKEKACWHL